MRRPDLVCGGGEQEDFRAIEEEKKEKVLGACV